MRDTLNVQDVDRDVVRDFEKLVQIIRARHLVPRQTPRGFDREHRIDLTAFIPRPARVDDSGADRAQADDTERFPLDFRTTEHGLVLLDANADLGVMFSPRR